MRTWIGSLAAVFALFATGAAATQPEPPVRHVVVFKYRPSASAAQISEVTAAFRALKDRIPGLVSFEHGKNHSPEKLDQGFTHVYLLTFTSVAARDAYLPHPEHKKFGELLSRLGVVESVFVVDFTAEP
jgi:hypothetical protein